MQDLVGDAGRGRGAFHFGQHHHEFIAAETGHDVAFAYAVAQALRHVLEQCIAYCMPERVVDGLEAIQIQEDHRQRTLFPVGHGECLLELALQTEAVDQAGKGVMVGELADLCLGQFACGDVRETGDVMGKATVGVAHDRDRHPLRIERAVFSPIQHLALPVAYLFEGGRHRLMGVVECLTGHQHLRVLASNVVDGVARQAGEGRIHRQDAVVAVTDEDGFAAVFEHVGVEPQCFLRLLALGDVLHGARGADRVAFGVEMHFASFVHPFDAAVRHADSMADLVRFVVRQ